MPKRSYKRNAIGQFAHTPGAKVTGKSGSSRKAPGLSSRKIARVKTQGRIGKAQKTIAEPQGKHLTAVPPAKRKK
jgi:hypothetical protein